MHGVQGARSPVQLHHHAPTVVMQRSRSAADMSALTPARTHSENAIHPADDGDDIKASLLQGSCRQDGAPAVTPPRISHWLLRRFGPGVRRHCGAAALACCHRMLQLLSSYTFAAGAAFLLLLLLVCATAIAICRQRHDAPPSLAVQQKMRLLIPTTLLGTDDAINAPTSDPSVGFDPSIQQQAAAAAPPCLCVIGTEPHLDVPGRQGGPQEDDVAVLIGLVKLCLTLGHRVNLLLFRPPLSHATRIHTAGAQGDVEWEFGALAQLPKEHRQLNVQVRTAAFEAPEGSSGSMTTPFGSTPLSALRSFEALEWLERLSAHSATACDIVHFVGTGVEAYYALLAQQQRLALAHTLLSIVLVSPLRWRMRHEVRSLESPDVAIELHMERRVVQEIAPPQQQQGGVIPKETPPFPPPRLLCPSASILEWLHEHGPHPRPGAAIAAPAALPSSFNIPNVRFWWARWHALAASSARTTSAGTGAVGLSSSLDSAEPDRASDRCQQHKSATRSAGSRGDRSVALAMLVGEAPTTRSAWPRVQSALDASLRAAEAALVAASLPREHGSPQLLLLLPSLSCNDTSNTDIKYEHRGDNILSGVSPKTLKAWGVTHVPPSKHACRKLSRSARSPSGAAAIQLPAHRAIDALFRTLTPRPDAVTGALRAPPAFVLLVDSKLTLHADAVCTLLAAAAGQADAMPRGTSQAYLAAAHLAPVPTGVRASPAPGVRAIALPVDGPFAAGILRNVYGSLVMFETSTLSRVHRESTGTARRRFAPGQRLATPPSPVWELALRASLTTFVELKPVPVLVASAPSFKESEDGVRTWACRGESGQRLCANVASLGSMIHTRVNDVAASANSSAWSRDAFDLSEVLEALQHLILHRMPT